MKNSQQLYYIICNIHAELKLAGHGLNLCRKKYIVFATRRPHPNVHCLVNIRGRVNINLFLAEVAGYVGY